MMEDKLIRTEKELELKQKEMEALQIQILTLNEEKQEASSLCKALYEQSIIYYNNFKAIETEYIKTCTVSSQQMEQGHAAIKKINDVLTAKVSNKTLKSNLEQVKEHVAELQEKLLKLQEVINQSKCNIDERKVSGLDEEEEQARHQSQYQQHSLIKVKDAESSLQTIAPSQESEQMRNKGKTEHNLLVDMETLFETEGNANSPMIESIEHIQNKLH